MNYKTNKMNNSTQETNDYCQESAWYFCEMHPAVREYIKKGELFPKCGQGSKHNTNWLMDVNQ